MARHKRVRPCQRRDVSVIAIGLYLLTGSFLPRVEDPWPDTIGLGFPFTLSAAFGVLAGFIYSEAPRARWDQAVRRGAFAGFCLGVVIYVISLVGPLVFAV